MYPRNCLAGSWLVVPLLLFCAGAVAVESKVPPITAEATNQPRPGKIVWADLVTGDLPRATAFYRDVFGWDIEMDTDAGYAQAALAGQPVAAFASYRGDDRAGEAVWLVSLAVLDVDAAVIAAGKAGGQIVQPAEDLPDRGRYALVRDSRGAPFMVLRATGGDPEDRPTRDNEWHWAELWTDDVPASVQFYEQVIGYRSVLVKARSGREFQVLGREEAARATVIKAPFPNVEPNWLPYLQVADVRETLRRVLAHGGKVYLAPQKDDFNNDIAIVADPTGGVFALQQREDDES